MFGEPKYNSMNWETASLKSLVTMLRNGANIKQNKNCIGFPITRIETIANRTVDRTCMGYAGITDITKYAGYVLQDGDILMSHINSIKHMGKSALYQKFVGETIIHGMNLLCLRPDQRKVNPMFLYMYFQMDYFYEQVLSITKPAVNQASMTITDLGALQFIVPPLDLQEQFVIFVRQCDKSKFTVGRFSNLNLWRCLENRRKILMQ